MLIPKILLDTDLETDCDDAGAIAVLHALRKDGIIELAGISSDSNYESSARFAAALNAACGKPEIPVCWNGSLPLSESYRTFLAPLLDSIVYHHLYVPPPEAIPVAQRKAPESDGVRFYRRILAEMPDHSVTVICIGFLTIWAAFLDSEPDEFSPLSGRELAARKTVRLATMAHGTPPAGCDRFNWHHDPAAAAKVLECWPTEIIVSAPGDTVLTGGCFDQELPPEHPLAQAFRIFGRNEADFRRPSWDEITVLAAVLNDFGGRLALRDGGRCVIDPESGSHRWRPRRSGETTHCFVECLAPDEELADEINRLMLAGALK